MSTDVSSKDTDVDIPTEKKLSSRACNVFNELRLSQKLCDAILVCDDGKEFPIHRAVMASASDFFRTLFTPGFNDSEQKEILITGVASDLMSSAIEWAYVRETNLHQDNVKLLLEAADYMNILSLVAECIKFLHQQITFDNCISLRKFGRSCVCPGLENAAHLFLVRNFCEVVKRSKELMELSLDEITEILYDDLLNVKNEEIVFETAIAWIDHDPIVRKSMIQQLLNTVRLKLLTTQYFVVKVKSHTYIRYREDCIPMIIDTLKFLYGLDMSEQTVDPNDSLNRPRIPHEIIVVVGGWSGGNAMARVETYDTRADRWILCDVTDEPRAYHGCAFINHQVYVIGGFDGIDYFNSVRSFDPVTKSWEERAPMHHQRCYVCVAVLENNIYALGGYNGRIRQITGEKYCPVTNQWTMIEPMNVPRSDAGATSLNGRVYICGGFNGEECLSTAEYYDPITSTWTLVAPMWNRRSGVSVISHKDNVYAVGGFNGISRMNSVERYSVLTNQWTSIAEMNTPRSNFAIEVIDDKIFVIGGFDGVTTISNVECYDPITEEWYEAKDMKLFRSALSCCLISGIPKMADFLYKNVGPRLSSQHLSL